MNTEIDKTKTQGDADTPPGSGTDMEETKMKIYNNNDAFGDGGPFEADSFEALADEMADSFASWSDEEWERLATDAPMADGIPTRDEYRPAAVERMRDEFLAGLTEVLHCDECGQDYHADAPERGHAADCSQI